MNKTSIVAAILVGLAVAGSSGAEPSKQHATLLAGTSAAPTAVSGSKKPVVTVQPVADFSADAGPSGDTSFIFIPQIAFQPGDWLFEWGEAFYGSSVYTDLMVARAL